MRDEAFANFRNVEVGNIKDSILYRSASPVDNTHNCAPIVDKLVQSVGVKYIVNLSDSETDLIEHINKSDFDSPYFLSLYNNGNVLPLSMDAQFKGDSFIESLAKALTSMSNNPGPYLIHCVEGKDRTGYVVMIIEALLGASYEEIIDDYMITYDNYYDITPIADSERYNTIKEKNIDLMLHYVIGDEEEKQNLAKISDYSAYVRAYLLSIGMDEEAINRLIQNLSKSITFLNIIVYQSYI
ncbi:tyrosine-protein phosphatase [Candidatus Saccharibacteria bacterium]|nr:tyrosine-protein phosphatase [Candidatus Saccharibacteria bacterium]